MIIGIIVGVLVGVIIVFFGYKQYKKRTRPYPA